VVAFCLGVESGVSRYLISLLFTLGGALLISVAHSPNDRVPQEAFIGIIYAGSTAISVLLLSHHPEGGEILHEMIAGSLLTVSPAELVKIAVLYGALGGFFYVFRGRFQLISTNRAAAREQGWNLVAWDFLFYAAFALVVTSSVAVAGVLLVFALLVIPPVAALLVTPARGTRLVLGWLFGAVGALAGVVMSVAMDYPAGPSVITTLTILLVLVAIWVRLKR
jgi:zinc/manganese transport system permease protein